MSQPANPHFFYPDTYHAFAALLVGLPGGALPEALNAVSAATGVVFVLGVAVLTGRLCGGSRLAAVASAVVAASAWTFPYLALAHGPLLPYALGVAVMCVVVAVIVLAGGALLLWYARWRNGRVAPALADVRP